MGLLDRLFGRRQVAKAGSSALAHHMREVRKVVEPLPPGEVGEFERKAGVRYRLE